ncbi:Aspartic proteinase CDR1 [Linum perenne]
MSDNNGILIDSGSELSYLPSKALDVVIAEVKKAAAIQGMKEVYTKFGSKLWAYQLCYIGTVDKEAFGFPPLGYHFEDGAQLLVDSVGLFVQVLDDAFCLGIHRTAYISIIGMTAQQGYNVGFDIKEKRMYFHSIYCEYLS